MSEPKAVGTVLVAVTLYKVDGHASCEALPCACPFLYSDQFSDKCILRLQGLARVEAESGYYYTPPLVDCPLRAAGALTLDELLLLAQGWPDNLFGPDDVCRVCGGHNNHAGDCEGEALQLRYDQALARVKEFADAR